MALTSPTGGGRSVGIVRSRTKATEFFFILTLWSGFLLEKLTGLQLVKKFPAYNYIKYNYIKYNSVFQHDSGLICYFCARVCGITYHSCYVVLTFVIVIDYFVGDGTDNGNN